MHSWYILNHLLLHEPEDTGFHYMVKQFWWLLCHAIVVKWQLINARDRVSLQIHMDSYSDFWLLGGGKVATAVDRSGLRSRFVRDS